MASTSGDDSFLRSADSMARSLPAEPRNGMIRVYDNSRQFTRPYSAKTVFFYKEGDEYFTGIRLAISKSRFRTMDSLLDELNENIDMPFGVRRITTPTGKTSIKGLEELEHLGKYVASSLRSGRGLSLNLSALERLRKARLEGRKIQQADLIPTASGAYKPIARMNARTTLNVLPSKQVFFVLNSKSKYHRMLLNPLRLPTMESLLKTVSEALGVAIFRLYTYEGKRIVNVSDILNVTPPKLIACPRNERPGIGDIKLPPLEPTNSTAGKNSMTSTSRTTQENGQNGSAEEKKQRSAIPLLHSQSENGIEKKKPEKRRIVAKRKPPEPLPALTPTTKSNIPKATNRPVRNASGASKIAAVKADDNDSGKANSISSRQTETPTNEDEASGESSAKEILRGKRPQNDERISEEEHTNDVAAAEEAEPKRRSPSVDVAARSSAGEPDAPTIEDDGLPVARTRRKKQTKRRKKRKETIQTTESSNADESQLKENSSNAENDVEAESSHEHAEVVEAETVEAAEDRPGSSGRKSVNEVELANVDAASDREVELRSEPGDGNKSDCEVQLPSERGGEEKPSTSAGVEQDAENSQEPAGTVRTEKELDEAATKIQAAYRGYRTRKQLKVKFDEGEEEVKLSNGMSNAEMRRTPREKRLDTPLPSDRIKEMTYTIQIKTGHRWGAETESDLFIELEGDLGKSDRCKLEAQTSEPTFRQGQIDIFHRTLPYLGAIQKLTIGHEAVGYGAGIFIDYISIVENSLDGRHFLFTCEKWLDSEQVDGRIKRTLALTAVYFQGDLDLDEARPETKSRWEFLFHTGTPDGRGGTTSNIRIVGYGITGSSVMTLANEATLREAPGTTLIQVDFGDIGELFKVRFEVDGSGDEPDYFLDVVELRDLDTEDRQIANVGKWLDFTGTKSKRAQSFRELCIYRPQVDPIALVSYEGAVFAGDTRLLASTRLFGRLVGDASDSGLFPLHYDDQTEEYLFKMECANIGRLKSVDLVGELTDRGEEVLEGMQVLQQIYDKHLSGVSVGSKIIGTGAWVRASTHAPYRYRLDQSRIMSDEAGEAHCKCLVLTAMEGMSTRTTKRNKSPEDDEWILAVTVVNETAVDPKVYLCVGRNAFEMTLDKAKSAKDLLIYQYEGRSIGLVDKVRIGVDDLGGKSIYLKKMRLRSSKTSTEVRWSDMSSHFTNHHVFEYSTVYPDIPPRLNVLYSIQIYSRAVTGSFTPYVWLIGLNGESGWRAYEGMPITENSEMIIDVEAVNLGWLQELMIRIEGDKKCSWTFHASVIIADFENEVPAGIGTLECGKTISLHLEVPQ